MQLGLPIGEYTVKDAIRGLCNFFTMTLFLSAVCYTGSRIALHYLTMRGSQLCDCCPGCIRTCLLILRGWWCAEHGRLVERICKREILIELVEVKIRICVWVCWVCWAC